MRKKSTTRNGKRKARSTRGAGRLYKRVSGGKEYPPDSPVNAPYWLQYTIPNPAGGRGKVVRVALHDADGKPITDRAEAEAERKRIVAPYQTGNAVETLKAVQARLREAEARHARAVEDANPPLRVADAWTAFTEAPERPDAGPNTLEQYGFQWTRFRRWLSEHHPDAEYLRDVTAGIAREYAANVLRAGYTANTFNKHVGFLKMLFRVLEDLARTPGNPFAKIKRMVQRPHSRRELTIPELTAILDRASGDLALLLYLGACTGLRLGDCATLQWGDVDLARGIVRRVPNKTAKGGKPVVLGLPPALYERLAATPRKARTGYVLPAVAKRYRRDVSLITNAVRAHIIDCGIDVHAPGTGRRIKRGPDGTPERNGTGRVVVEDTGNPAVVEVGFHSLRHTWVSLHAQRGTPQAVIQASVGHANPAMTRHYTHISEATARDTARALPVFAGNGNGDAAPDREPLPEWARKLAEGMTAKTWKTAKAALLSR